MSTPSLAQLQRALSIAEQIQNLEAELAGIIGGGSPATFILRAASKSSAKKGNRTMSAATVARMRASQQARWAKIKGAATAPSKAPATAPKKKGGLTPEGRARLAAKMKARWAARKTGTPALNSSAKPTPVTKTMSKRKAGTKGQPWYAK